MKIKSILLFLSILSLQAFATNGEIHELKCDSGAIPGQIKRWHFNHKDVFEIYPNGYRRVYDLQKKENHNIFASEDAANGMYYVTIRLDKDERSVTVVTPLATYIDSNCQRIK
ncbi:MAG: hypothetical protein VX765_01935 [Pseudomonadota bacterium]|nr:hypothetical protein [Pseudomonadota bacterium]